MSSSPAATVDSLADFRATRRSAAIAKRGPASFVWGAFVTTPDSAVTGAPGLWSPAPDGRAALLVRATASEGIRIVGDLVDGEALLFADETDGPTVAEFADGAEGVLFTYDRSKFALQVWNPQSDWASRFADIRAFAENPSLVVDARVSPVTDGRVVAITHHRDPRPVDVRVIAEVAFEIDGTTHTLLATPTPVAEGLVVHFTDSTNRESSYASGRSLRCVPDADGHVTLDFNYATLLPCAFSLAWNCPIPPAENALPFAVTAGEQFVVDAAGKALL